MNFTLTDTACPHAWDEASLRTPPRQSIVHKDECAYCCRACHHQPGIYVCMTCFTGVCGSHIAKHMECNASHVMYTRVAELPPKEPQAEVKDTNKLGIQPNKEYEHALCCASCKVQFLTIPELASASFNAIVHAPVPGAAEATSADALLFAKPECPHLVCLEQLPSPFAAGTAPSSSDVCSTAGCGCAENNWMCVTCGNIGCPRAESGGKGHALAHYAETGHPASVKLGTTVADGADFYCYQCDDAVADVHYAAHMRHFGIDVLTAQKTAKTLGEMEYDYSSQFDFNKITEVGVDLVPCFGPGHTGIYNIGNSCYIAAVVQCLMRFPIFQESFFPGRQCAHQRGCRASPYACRHCQLERLAAGLLSGEFSRQGAEPRLNGVCPRLFKNVFAGTHAEFSSGAQQDSQEYLLYLLEEMRRHVRTGGPLHPSDAFEVVMEQRTQCAKCRKVRYTHTKESCLSLAIPVEPPAPTAAAAAPAAEPATAPERPRVTLQQCLSATFGAASVECKCECCEQPSVYENTTHVRTFPNLLAVYLRRAYFDRASLATKKLDVFVDVPQLLDLGAYRGTGLRAGEEAMPESPRRTHKTATATAEVDEVALATVMSMGIDVGVARYALQQTGMDVERAVDYIFSHPDLQEELAGGGDRQEAERAAVTAATDGGSTYELVGMVSHIGASARTGHYVCHIKDPAPDGGAAPARWVLFNDEKVGESKEPPFSMASVYFFQRKEK